MFQAKSQHSNKVKPNNAGLFQNEGSSASFIQAKLEVGEPGDRYELEADQAADAIVKQGKTETADQPFFNPSPPKQGAQHIQSKPITPPITKQVQRLFDKDIQEKKDEEIQKKEDEPIQNKKLVQRKADAGASNLDGMESKLQNPSGGKPLPSSVKGEMESGFGTDFSKVNVHTDASAVQMSQDLGAQAFTHGNDIYFNEGKYDTQSDSGKHLLAHELTHTIQQGASVQPKMIQKTGEDTTTEFGLPNGTTLDTSSRELILPMISLPRFKQRNADRFPLNMQLRQGGRSNTQQIQFWETEMRPTVTSATSEKLDQARSQYSYGTGEDVVFFLKPQGESPLRVFGNESTLLNTFLIPFWDQNGLPTTFQVDHIHEDQMGGHDDIYNYELLEAGANGSAGPTIAAEIRARIKEAIDGIKADSLQEPNFSSEFTYGTSVTELTRVKNDYEITFTEREFTKEIRTGNPDSYWGILGFLENRHIDMLRVMSPSEVEEEGLSGSNPEIIRIFPGASGGVPFDIPWGAAQPSNTYVDMSSQELRPFAGSRLELLGVSYSPSGSAEGGNVGFLRVRAFKSDGSTLLQVNGNSTFDWQLDLIPGLEFGGSINASSVAGSVRNSLRLPGMSPIEINEATLHPVQGLMANGKVLPTVPVISEADIDIVIEGDSVRLRKLFTSEEFQLPAPFEISDTSLEVFVGTDGVGVEGNLNFAINNVGEGHIGASASTSGGFELEGAFNFDSELFDPAEISVEYRDDVWTIGGEIGIPEGKVRGVKNATITAEYSEGNFTATGEAELDVPGVDRGSMTINYGDEGFSISGEFDLSSDIPGINGGNVEARVAKEEGAENYDVFVSGTAQPAIPGIDTELTVTYENGAITISGEAGYERGLLSGRVNIGATNRPIGEEGEPVGEPDDTMRVYGGGSLTLQLAPWLEATAGVQFLPNGEIEVVGRIGLPSTLDVFDRQEFNRNLFSVPTVEIPLFAIPLGPRSLGLVAQINGGLDFTAGFGPGQLREVFAEVTYNPDRPEETEIHGHGEFAIPADAGLTLRGDLGLGLSVGIASLTGGIELTGTLGLAGEAAAEVDLSYSPQTGIVLDANGRITVNPLFEFTVNALVRGTLGVSPFSISEEWRENLAAFEWGPSIEFGIVFPVHYQEDQPFEISTDDVEVIYPDLDIVDMAKDLATDVKDQIF